MLSKKLIIFSFALLALFSVSSAETISDDILQLNNGNFEANVKELPYIFLIFYDPLQQNTQQILQEFSTTALSLKQEDHPIRFAKIDLRADIDIARKLMIGTYPIIKLICFGKQKTYEGKMIEAEMKPWIKENIQLPQLLSNLSEFEEAIEKNNITVVFWGDNKMNEYVLLNYIAEDHKDLNFAYTNSKEVKEKYSTAENPLSIFKKFDEPRVDYKGYFYADGLKRFLSSNKTPLLIDFDPQYSRKFFYGNVPTIILIYSENKESQKALEALNLVKEQFKGKVFLTIKNKNDKWGEELLEIFGDSNVELPLLAIARPSLQGPLKFVLGDTYITDKVIKQFYQDCLEGQEAPYYKSQPIPKSNDETVKVVVGKTFNNIVNDETKNVFVLFYANWSQISKGLLEIWKELGEKMKSNEELIFAKIDADSNEVEDYENIEVPSLILFPKNKPNTVKYFGTKDAEAIKQWLEPKLVEIEENQIEEEEQSLAENDDKVIEKDESSMTEGSQVKLEEDSKVTSNQTEENIQTQAEKDIESAPEKESLQANEEPDISKTEANKEEGVNPAEKKETKSKTKTGSQKQASKTRDIDL